MIASLIRWSIANRFLVLLGTFMSLETNLSNLGKVQ